MQYHYEAEPMVASPSAIYSLDGQAVLPDQAMMDPVMMERMDSGHPSSNTMLPESMAHYTYDPGSHDFTDVIAHMGPVTMPLSPPLPSPTQGHFRRTSSGQQLQYFSPSATNSPDHPSRAHSRHSSGSQLSPLGLAPAFPHVSVVSVAPVSGPAGTVIKIVINVRPSPTAAIRSFRVSFGPLDAITRVAFENRASAVEHVELLATAPHVEPAFQAGRVGLLVQAIDATDTVLASAEAGTFDYVESKHHACTPKVTS